MGHGCSRFVARAARGAVEGMRMRRVGLMMVGVLLALWAIRVVVVRAKEEGNGRMLLEVELDVGDDAPQDETRLVRGV